MRIPSGTRFLFLCLVSIWEIAILGCEPVAEGESKRSSEVRVVRDDDLGSGIKVLEAEKRYGENGRQLLRSVTVTRDKQKMILFVETLRDSKRESASRFYLHNGSTVLQEADEDGDGFFELTVFYDKDGLLTEMFERKKDGTVLPVSSSRLEESKRADKDLTKFVAPLKEIADKGIRGPAAKKIIEGMIEKAVKSGLPREGDSTDKQP